MLKSIKSYLLVIPLLVIVSACDLNPVKSYDSTRHQNLQNLQVVHTKFINDFTAGGAVSWSSNAVNQACNDGKAQFNSALSHAQNTGGKDKTAANAVSKVFEQFNRNCAFSLKRGKAFSQAWAGEEIKLLKKNYAEAIKGETSREGGPN